MSNPHQPAVPIQQQPNLNSAPFPQCFLKPFNNKPLQIKRNVITDDYSVTSQVLGMGINGRVLECFHKDNGEKFALKVNTLSSWSHWVSCHCCIMTYIYRKEYFRAGHINNCIEINDPFLCYQDDFPLIVFLFWSLNAKVHGLLVCRNLHHQVIISYLWACCL